MCHLKTVITTRFLVPAALCCGIFFVDLALSWSEKSYADEEWPVFGGDYANTRYSTLDQINRSNIAEVGAAWVHEFEEGSSRATPVVSGGRLYINAGSHAYALDLISGETIWSTELEVAPTGLYRGGSIGEGMYFLGLSNGQVVALDQKTGKKVWHGRASDNPPRPGQFISRGPVYANGIVITGLANGDYGIRGRVVGLDAKTGKELWRFNTIPGPGEFGFETWQVPEAGTPENEAWDAADGRWWERAGGGVWVNPAVDHGLGLVYFGVGNPVPQWGGEIRPGDNLFTNSLLALDIETGKLRWHWQSVRHDIWDNGLGTPPILTEVELNGKNREVVAVMRTDGYLFMFDRETGEAVWPIEERPVPQNERLRTAKTQPFPVGADQVGSPCVPEEILPEGFEAYCDYQPIDKDMPNAIYGILTTRSAPMAYSPQTRYFYAAGSNMAHWVRRFDDPNHFIVNKPPGLKSNGLLAAIDSRTNKLVWEKRLPYMSANGTGITATAGGLIFLGQPDGYLHAYDASSGDRIWSFQTGDDVNGAIAVYEAKGDQYVVVTTTRALWSFKLGGEIGERNPPTPPPTETGFTGRIVRTSAIEFGAVVRDYGLEKVRESFEEYGLSPQRARVKAGSELKFENKGNHTHSATATNGNWSTGPIAPGHSRTVEFTSPGTYTYTCEEHPWTHGQITVQ